MASLSDDWKLTNAWTVLDRPEYKFELEEYRRGEDQMVFIHLAVRKWSKSVLKQCIHEFKLFRECTDAPLYACGEEDNDKWAHFVSLFGFKPLSEAICTDGKRRRIFISIKDNNNEFVVRTEDGQHGDQFVHH